MFSIKDKIKNEAQQLEREIAEVKGKIDLKALLKQFHEIEKKRKLIRNYRENFSDSLKKDEDLEIVEILEEGIGEEIRRVKEKSVQLNKGQKTDSIEEKLELLEKMAAKTDHEIVNRIEGENKKLKKFNERGNTLQSEILEKSKDILGNVEIVN